MFNSGIIPASWQGPLHALLRVVTGLLFIEHGTVKFLDFPKASGMESLPPLLLVGSLMEIVGGALIVLGLFTRWTAFILAGEMAVAYFMFHFATGGFWPINNGGEPAILFCFIFLFFAAAGAGPYSVDDSRK